MMLKEIADGFGVSTKTVRRWINARKEKIGVRLGRYFTCAQVLIINDLFGPFVSDDPA